MINSDSKILGKVVPLYVLLKTGLNITLPEVKFVDRHTNNRVVKGQSFIVICPKSTQSQQCSHGWKKDQYLIITFLQCNVKISLKQTCKNILNKHQND